MKEELGTRTMVELGLFGYILLVLILVTGITEKLHSQEQPEVGEMKEMSETNFDETPKETQVEAI